MSRDTLELVNRLNAEWEEYEEPKGIKSVGTIGSSVHIEMSSKEGAEKAVEKLKAWERLKDARFKFTDFGYNLDELSSSTIGADGKICFEMICYEDFSDDLELLFGGEE